MGAGVAGDEGVKGSGVSLIPRIMPQLSGDRDRSITGVGYRKREPGAPRGTPGSWSSDYEWAGAKDGATDSGMCDGPGPPTPCWNPVPWPWGCGPPWFIEW